jgi:hypothetical protein
MHIDCVELKRLAIAAQKDCGDYMALNDYGMAMPPAVCLALIAENERLRNLPTRNVLIADREKLIDQRSQLKDENELARMRIKELDLLFGRYILAMRSALIEEEHGKGPAAAMEWIYNSLAGPGELPPEGETDSQAYFDREIVAVDDGMQEVMAFHEGRRAAMGNGEQS